MGHTLPCPALARQDHQTFWFSVHLARGPAYAFGKGHCVNWGGNIDNRHVQIYNSNCGLQERRVTFTR